MSSEMNKDANNIRLLYILYLIIYKIGKKALNVINERRMKFWLRSQKNELPWREIFAELHFQVFF